MKHASAKIWTKWLYPALCFTMLWLQAPSAQGNLLYRVLRVSLEVKFGQSKGKQMVRNSPNITIAAALLGFCTNIVHVNRAKSKWIRSAYSTCWCLLFVTVPQEISSPHIRSIDLCKYWSITSKQETIIYICGLQIYMAKKKKEYKSAGTFSCTFAAGSPFPVWRYVHTLHVNRICVLLLPIGSHTPAGHYELLTSSCGSAIRILDRCIHWLHGPYIMTPENKY